MNPIARILVRETAGIRRFLYPVTIAAPPGALPDLAPGERRRVCELDGTPLPSKVRQNLGVQEVTVALSMSPREERELILAETKAVAAVPDAIRFQTDPAGGFFARQERLAIHVGAKTGLDSVIYDGVEHLAGPVAVSCDGRHDIWARLEAPSPDSEGLAGSAVFMGPAASGEPAESLTLDLTACKSWVTLNYATHKSLAGAVVRFRLPLRVLDSVPTCDFGAGHGVYEKIVGDAVVWSAELSARPYARWQVATIAGGRPRTDYEGEVATADEFRPTAWFHFTERTKALAVAILAAPPFCERLEVSLGREGIIDIGFEVGAGGAGPAARFSICCHFLNDIPPVAAATNPASILQPPVAQILPLI